MEPGDPRFNLFPSTITQFSHLIFQGPSVCLGYLFTTRRVYLKPLHRVRVLAPEAGFHMALFVPLSPAMCFHPKFEWLAHVLRAWSLAGTDWVVWGN